MSAARHVLHNELASIVGGENVLGEDFSAYVQDKSPFPQITPGIVVRPGSIDETSAVMALANRTRTPVTTRGGGFSLTGFLQSGESIVLDTKRMNRVVEIDEINMTVTAECGIIMKDLHDQCAARGFFCPHCGDSNRVHDPGWGVERCARGRVPHHSSGHWDGPSLSAGPQGGAGRWHCGGYQRRGAPTSIEPATSSAAPTDRISPACSWAMGAASA